MARKVFSRRDKVYFKGPVKFDGSVVMDTDGTIGNTTVNATDRLYFRDSGIYIYSNADGKMTLMADGTDADDITIGCTTTYSDNITISTDKKLYLRDTGLYLYSNADGKLTLTADGTGADDITISGTTTHDDNITIGTDKKIYLRDSGIYIQSSADGKILISSDGGSTDDITLSGTITLDDDLFTPTDKKIQFRDANHYIHSSGAGVITIVSDGGSVNIDNDFSYGGHKLNQVLHLNIFTNPGTDWVPQLEGMNLAANKSAKKFWIPLPVKVGDEINSYMIVGDVTEVGGDTVTLDAKIVKINIANPITTTDITGGGISQVTADGNFTSVATLSAAETVATGKQYVIEVNGTTSNVSGTEQILIMGVELRLNRK